MLRSSSPTSPILTAGDLGANATSFARHLRAANLSPATQRTYLAAIERLAAFLEASGMPTDVSYLGAKAAKAIDRYERRRRQHTHANLPWLWLGEKGRLTDSGLAQIIRRRGREIGMPALHAHPFRHHYAHEALSSGMQEGEVMALAGWRSREMLSRYAKSAERDRAIASARRLAIGDRL